LEEKTRKRQTNLRITYSIERAVLAKGRRQRIADNIRPRDAAALLVVDNSGRSPRILFGRRRTDQNFAPDVYVFPGGSVEPEDYMYALTSDLHAEVAAKLKEGTRARGAMQRARALGVAALREAFEEAGVTCGPYCALSRMTGEPPAFQWLPLQALRLIARAVTPPFQTRRFDTRFLAINAREITLTGCHDGELRDVGWLTFEEARARNLHIITRTVLGDLERHLFRWGLDIQPPAIPIYFKRGAGFQRQVI
jgi:8-oxo-dGTP pyrophosphatase MutT (NUDIX family)